PERPPVDGSASGVAGAAAATVGPVHLPRRAVRDGTSDAGTPGPDRRVDPGRTRCGTSGSDGGDPMKAVLTTPEEAGPRRDVPVSGSRRARMVIKRVDPLSVLKVSLIFYLCMALVFDAVAIITYWSLSALGALGSMTDLLTSLGF